MASELAPINQLEIDMYYRILVNLNGEKLFRTSRLHSTGDMIAALRLISHPEDQLDVSVLAVDDEGEGAVLTHEELQGVITAYDNPDGIPTSTAEIKEALADGSNPHAGGI